MHDAKNSIPDKPKGDAMIRDTQLDDLQQVAKFQWIDVSKVEEHLKNKGCSKVCVNKGSITGFLCESPAPNVRTIFVFNWVGSAKSRKRLLRETLKKLTIHNKCIVNIHPDDKQGKRLARSHHFQLDRVYRGYEIWVHKYHPDNFYYQENPFN